MIEKSGDPEHLPNLESLKNRLRHCLADLKAISLSDDNGSQFFTQLLNRITEFTGAIGVTIWRIDRDQDGLISMATQGLHAGSLQLTDEQLDQHQQLVRFAAVQTSPLRVPPKATISVESSLINPSSQLLLMVPVSNLESENNHVIEVFLQPGVPDDRCRVYLTFLAQFSNLVSMWLIRGRLRDASLIEKNLLEAVELTRNVHDSLDPKKIAFLAVNDGRSLLNCDRLCLLQYDGSKCRVLAVSGQDDFNVRSNVLAKLSRLATVVCKTRQAVWSTADQPLAPQIQQRLDEFVEETSARTVAIIPLIPSAFEQLESAAAVGDRQPPVGALVLDYVDRDLSTSEQPRYLNLLVQHTTRALINSNVHHSIFLLPLWRTIGKTSWFFQRGRISRTLIVLGLILALAAALFFLPAPFEMRVSGELQPVMRRNVFAGSSGIVRSVHVAHLDPVRAGQLLAVIQDDQLEFQTTEISGVISQVEKDVLSTESAILADRDQAAEQLQVLNQQLLLFKQRLVNLREQESLLKLKQERLNIYSPIDGTVISWDVERRLQDRPVQATDLLLVVADLDSGWQVQVYVAENKIGHVLERRNQTKPLGDKASVKQSVTFFATTNPYRRFRGNLYELENHTEQHPEFGRTIRGFVEFDQKTNSPELFVGAAVRAKIDCGRRPIGYVWFHQLIEFTQSQVLF